MTYKKKINWLLILQAWAMLWVVIGHAFIGDIKNQVNWPFWERSLMDFAYSFHMPLFMLISGWLFYYTRLKQNFILTGGGYISLIKDKVKRLLLPGFFFSVVAFILKLVFPGEMVRQTSLSLNEIVHSLLVPVDNPFQELWFIVVLFIFFLMTPIWKLVLERRWTTWALVFILLPIHYINPKTQFLSLDRVCIYAIWFYLGLLFSKEDLVGKLFEKRTLLTIIIGVSIYILGKLIVLSILENIGGILFSFGIALLFDKILPRLFSSFRDYTYQIFLIGIFAQIFIKILYRHLPIPYMAAYLLCIVAGLYVPVLVSKLIEIIKWKPLLLCVGLKTK